MVYPERRSITVRLSYIGDVSVPKREIAFFNICNHGVLANLCLYLHICTKLLHQHALQTKLYRTACNTCGFFEILSILDAKLKLTSSSYMYRSPDRSPDHPIRSTYQYDTVPCENVARELANRRVLLTYL